MSTELSLKECQKEWHGTMTSYIAGFIISLMLTLFSFFLVYTKIISGKILIPSLIALAVIQAIFQLRLFLHVGQEPKPQWETLTLYFTILVLLIVALGSLWIMYDLNARMMPEMDMNMDMNMDMPHD